MIITTIRSDRAMSAGYDSSPQRDAYDAVIVGAGPNGLAAAVTLAKAGRSVLVMEAGATIGGGLRSMELTQPGFLHDVCASIHALGNVSPFFLELAAEDADFPWTFPTAACAHPLDDGTAAITYKSVEETADALGRDAGAYRRLILPLANRADVIVRQVLGPLRLPQHPWTMSRFGLAAIRSADALARRFKTPAAKALLAGMAAHSTLPFYRGLSGGVGVLLTLGAHAGGWPICRGGSQQIADRLAQCLRSRDGEIVVNCPVESLADIPTSRAVLFDVIPRTLLRIAGGELPARYRRQLERFRHGLGIFKVDWALDEPIPWQNPECQKAATVHVGGTYEEIAAAEDAPWRGQCAERPFVLVTQPSLFDSSRAPPGKHTAWGYCHVPRGTDESMTERIELQIERFAPGFRDRILARHAFSPQQWENYNANYFQGDITAGVMDIPQAFVRPTWRWNPYTTPNPRFFLCSASTPPGPGIHGMCGYYAAKAVLRSQ